MQSIATDLQTRVAQRYLEVRKHSENLCSPLEKEDFVVQPVVDVSPPKWHLAHTTWFFEEFILSKYLEGYKRFHPSYAFLFNSYYENVGERVLRPNRGNMSRPTVNDVMAYREHVDEHMVQLAEFANQEVEELIVLGLNHEQQHQELLLTDIKYILGHNPLFPAYDPGYDEGGEQEQEIGFILMEEKKYLIGFEGKGFSYDNEHGRHEVLLPTFSISKRLVTNGEYTAFIEDGGYENVDLWHSDAWAWLKEAHVQSPMYWHKIEDQWHRYALSGLKTLDPKAPVTHLSFYEAFAFAEWSGMRLPTEFEWEAASDQFDWGHRWEHTGSAYLPYPGFKKAEGAIGEYNGKFMVNQMVLRGASIATPKGHSRKTYRNFFHPSLRWQFNGIRLCKK